MNAKIYTVQDINGDYAVLSGENEGTVNISVFLLPSNIDIGDKVLSSMCQYEKI